MVDYILVGLGLAGVAFCEKLGQHNKSFVVFDDGKDNASAVAGGLYNPVVLKRFTPVWKAQEQLALLPFFYSVLETKLQTKLNYKTPVYRLFHSVEEQNLWFEASDKLPLAPFLSTTIITNENPSIKAPFGFGEVLKSGRIDTERLLQSYRNYLARQGKLITDRFDYQKLQLADRVAYEGISAKHLVFAEGFGLKNNPFFKGLPLVGNKGELLTIKAPALKLDSIIKASVFIIPLGNELYRVGATYHWTDKTAAPTEAAKGELISKLDKLIDCPYEVVAHEAGVRPTVTDRKPLIGVHPVYKNLFVLNGLGTRGVMIAPYVANRLFEFIEEGKPLDEEINIQRFA